MDGSGAERLSGMNPGIWGTMLLICAFYVEVSEPGYITPSCNLHHLYILYTSAHFSIWPSSLHPPFLTNYLEAPVFVKLSNVSRAEPPLAVLIYKEILLVFCLVLVVSHGYVGSTNQNLPSWVWPVSAAVTTWKQVFNSVDCKWKLR